MKALDDEKTKELAKLQLQLAILEGKEWAVKHALGLPDISINGKSPKWEVEITHVGNKVKGPTDEDKAIASATED